MARKSNTPDRSLREWRISMMRDKVHYLGRVVAPDEETAIDRANGWNSGSSPSAASA